VQSRHGDTAELLREFISRLGSSSSREGRYSQLAPRTANRPQASWDFHCNLRPGPGVVAQMKEQYLKPTNTTFQTCGTAHLLYLLNLDIVPADVSFIHPLTSYLCSAACTPGHAVALRDADKHRDYYADHACPGYAFRSISVESLGRFSFKISRSTMQFLYEATHAAFPQPGHQRAACFVNVYRQLSVVQCRYLSRMLIAATGLQTVRSGSA
jgi:hypothetical protein